MEKEPFDDSSHRLAGFFREFDKETLVIIKGHLLIEEKLNSIIGTFVHHDDYIKSARLSFYQKMYIAKSMSLSESENSTWALIETLNTLRNDIAHNLHSEKREKKFEQIRKLYEHSSECKKDWEKERFMALGFTISFCIGFLRGLKLEVCQLRTIITQNIYKG